MAVAGTIDIEVVFGLPERQILVSLSIDAQSTVGDAIRASGIADEFPQHDVGSCKVGIWGRPTHKDQSLQAGDRIEIYRPMEIDPREARRQLAEQGGFMGRRETDDTER